MEGGSGSESGSVFSASLEGMKHVKSEDGEMLTKPFLEVCKNILPVIDKFGAAMTLVKYDVGGNISYLYSTEPTNPESTMSQACSDSYSKTLKKWHGWLASSSFSVAMKLVPDRTKFMAVIGGTSDLNSEIESFCANFTPLLEENHKFLGRPWDPYTKLYSENMSSGNKVKGFFKGIKFITKKYESEKEAEIQIGAPTDVKHVAHIGGDGPSVNPPSWMSDPKGEESEAGDDEVSTRELSDLPKPSSRERSEKDKSRSSRRSSRHKGSDKAKSGRGSDLESDSVDPDREATKKKTRRKKSKDLGLRTKSSRSVSTTTGSDLESESESKSQNDRRDK